MKVEVTEAASVDDIIAVRAAVLRPGRPVSAARYPEDGGEWALHLRADVDGQVVGCGSLYRADYQGEEAQRIRGMAVLAGFQAAGVGSLVLAALQERAMDRGFGHLIWLNARERAIPFYERAGFAGVGGIFEVPGIGPHRLMVFKW